MRRLDTPPYQFAIPDEEPLRGLFERALGGGEQARMALYAGVGELVRRAKNDSVPIERILVALKEIVGASHRPGRAHSAQTTPTPDIALLDAVVRWCIEQYYEPPGAAS